MKATMPVALVRRPSGAANPLTWSGTQSLTATQSVSYSIDFDTLCTHSGALAITYSVQSGSLPAGLSLNGSTGVLSGTPTTVAVSNFTIRATEGPWTADRAFTFTVSSASLVAPASGLTYQNRIYKTMDYANDAAATSDGFTMGGASQPAQATFVADPAGGGLNVWRTRYVANEDEARAQLTISPAAKYLYRQWEEYWHPSYTHNSGGEKADRAMDDVSGIKAIDHLLVWSGENQGELLMQGTDGGPFVEWLTTIPKGQWVKWAIASYLHPSTGYIRIWKDIGSGWELVQLRYGSPFIFRDQYDGATAANTGRSYDEYRAGGWFSGATPGANNFRYIRNLLLLYNETTAPT